MSLSGKPERNCTNIWIDYQNLFPRPYALISQLQTLPPVQQICLCLMRGEQNHFHGAESALQVAPGHSTDSVDGGTIKKHGSPSTLCIFIPPHQLSSEGLGSCLGENYLQMNGFIKKAL